MISSAGYTYQNDEDARLRQVQARQADPREQTNARAITIRMLEGIDVGLARVPRLVTIDLDVFDAKQIEDLMKKLAQDKYTNKKYLQP